MFRRFAGAVAFAVVFVGAVLAADKEIKGKVVKFDPDTRKITVKTDTAEEDETLLVTAKIFDDKGKESADGLKDKRIAKGADVKLVIPEGKRNVSELHLLPAAKADPKTAAKTDPKATAKTDPKTPAKTEAKTDPKTPAKTEAKTEPKVAAKPDPKPDVKTPAKTDAKTPAKTEAKKPEKPASAGAAKFGTDAKGDLAKITKLDVEKRTVSVELDNGKKFDYTIADDAKFVGPRGGKGSIKDDRFEEGDFVKIVVDGKKVTEVHLAFRVNPADEKDEKK